MQWYMKETKMFLVRKGLLPLKTCHYLESTFFLCRAMNHFILRSQRVSSEVIYSMNFLICAFFSWIFPLTFRKSLDFFFHCHLEWKYFHSYWEHHGIALLVLFWVTSGKTYRTFNREEFLLVCPNSPVLSIECDLLSPPRPGWEVYGHLELQWLWVLWIIEGSTSESNCFENIKECCLRNCIFEDLKCSLKYYDRVQYL